MCRVVGGARAVDVRQNAFKIRCWADVILLG